MALNSHDHQTRRRRLGPAVASLGNGVSGVRAALVKALGVGSSEGSARNGKTNEHHHGMNHGSNHGNERGKINGRPHGNSHGDDHGHHDGVQSGKLDGPLDGKHRSELERELDLDFHVVGGLVHACAPGTSPPLGATYVARAFLAWLQSRPPFPGNEVPARIIEDHLYPFFAETELEGMDRSYSWRTIAVRFADLPGVKRRQRDGRVGSDRAGPSLIVYRIPAAEH